MLAHRLHRLILMVMLMAGAAQAAPLSRSQALQALHHLQVPARLAAVQTLAENGRTGDADRLVPVLADIDAQVRGAAASAMWQIWSRSGDRATDALFARGVAQMQASALDDALTTFSEIVRRRPAFAEGWNKRATVYFMMGRDQQSLQDCGEVFKRNRNHFGALSGAGQIHLRLGNWQLALECFRRALQINPDLVWLEGVIETLEERLRERARKAI